MNTKTTAAASPQTGAVKFAMFLSGALFFLMMLAGAVMRAAQGRWIDLDPAHFYQILTAHGAGMVGTAAFSGAAIMWFFVGRHVRLVGWVFHAFVGLFLLGAGLVLGAIFIGGFGAGWTFLFPLPAQSGGAWEIEAAAVFLSGLISIGVAFLLLYLETGRAILASYDNLATALGWRLAFGDPSGDAPPPTIIAASTVAAFNTLGIVVGAAVLTVSLLNLYLPEFTIDALLAKNMIYFFGHVFINASIYMAVIAVYEIVPEYTGREWKSTRAFALAWASIFLFVMAVYPHHLMQDMVMPPWMLIMAQVVSYLSGIPLLAVTAFALVTYLWRSGMRWDLAAALLVLGVAGWSVGAVPAIADAIISVNRVMHNTLWVPGHFHVYLLLGEVAMAFGFMMWLSRDKTAVTGLSGLDRAGFVVYVLGGAGLALTFLVSGALSIPRRWAVHVDNWVPHDRLGTVFAVLAIVGTLIFIVRYAVRLRRTE